MGYANSRLCEGGVRLAEVAHMSINMLVGLVVAAWLASSASSILALIFCLQNPPRRFRTSLLLASIGLFIGYLGFGHWSPFRFFPQIGYTWVSDTFKFSLASSWFFVAPLVTGAGALVRLLWLSRTTHKEKRDAEML